jgi:hypothetical protein
MDIKIEEGAFVVANQHHPEGFSHHYASNTHFSSSL